MHTVNKICTIVSYIAVYHKHEMDGIALVGYKLYKFDLYSLLFILYCLLFIVYCLLFIVY